MEGLMRVIRIDDDVWQAMKKRAEAFEDTPNDVLRRILGLEREKKRTVRSRLPRGQKTPGPSYRPPILRALYEMGGKGKTATVLARVEELMKDQLNKVDRIVTSNIPRWSNTAQWERLRMVKEGLINKKPHGMWELTEKGRTAAKQTAAKNGW
jgi:hypothetical protein